jgi:hypothetical protein
MNINQLLKQAQTMQKQMKDLQDEMASKEFEGKSGGGLVTIVTSGDGQMRRVSIDKSLFKEDEKEILEDLIVAAFNEAKHKAEEESKQTMTGAFGGMAGIIPGMN